MTIFKEECEMRTFSRYSHIYSQSYEKYINEEGMPDFRKWGLSSSEIYEYTNKVSQHDIKWAFGGKGIEDQVFIWCACVGWLVCGGMGYLMSSEWGLVLGLVLMVGNYYLICMILKYIERKEREAINSKLIENYLEEYQKWRMQRYPYL